LSHPLLTKDPSGGRDVDGLDAGGAMCPEPPPGAVNVLLGRRADVALAVLRSTLTAAAFRAGVRLGSGFGETKAGGLVCSPGSRGADGGMTGSRRKLDGAAAWDAGGALLGCVREWPRVKCRWLALLAAQRKSATVAVAVSASGEEHVLDDFDDALLLPPGEFGSVVENLPEFAGRAAAAWLWRVPANEEVGADFE
jgi:hypothetical protein